MFKNYLKTGLRNFRKNNAQGFLNVMALVKAMTDWGKRKWCFC
jgi:hypothetical protein